MGLGDKPSEDIDLGNLNDTARIAQLIQLLPSLIAMNKEAKKGPAQGVGDILSEQRARKESLADSYAPGSKYEAGWEPGGIMDSFAGGLNAMHVMPNVTIDDHTRLLNPQGMDDLGDGWADALALGTQLRDSGDTAGPYDNVIAQIIKSILPPEAGGGASASPMGGTPSGRGAPPYDPKSAPGPMGGGPRRNVPVMPSAENPSSSASGIIEAANQQTVPTEIRKPSGPEGPEGPAGSMSAEGTAALLGAIFQRLGPRATPGPNRKRGTGDVAPLPTKLTGYEDGGAAASPVSGPQVIRVGERKAGDKKYATEEVIFAPPGTIVAPVPRGMENPSHEDAVSLLISQLLKEPGREVAPHTGGQAGPASPGDFGVPGAARGIVTSSATKGRTAAGSAMVSGFNSGRSQRNNERDYNWGQTQYYQNRDRSRQVQDRDYAMQRQQHNMNMANQAQDVDFWSARNQFNRSQQSGGGGGSDRSRQDANAHWQDEFNLRVQEHQDELRNWEAERALKQMLGMRGLDIDKQRADQSYQLDSAQTAFQQIMAGITGSALPGVRAGQTPKLGLFG